MPELPEVETMRRGVSPAIGHQIVSAECPPCSRKPILMEPNIQQWDRQLKGRTISSVGRIGKRVVLHIDEEHADALAIVIEPRMTGLVLIADPPGAEHLRLRLRLSGANCEELLFWDRRGLGTARLLTQEQLRTRVQQRLGEDALCIEMEALRARLRESRRAIKVALLDQSIVAGIGNLYAAEILFLAGVDPRTRCEKLSKPQWRRIHAAIAIVLNQAIAHEGSTLSDGTYRNALNHEGNYQNYHLVYDRAGESCRRCGVGVIRRIVQAQRSTFFCPACQRRSGRHSAVKEILVSPTASVAVQ
ncbi:MAG: bifunctional DNA-formamidopyrimidine glycosylase/DNA-(apurinic or apyrimidinic site) lyase [Planctomycetota bacterium]